MTVIYCVIKRIMMNLPVIPEKHLEVLDQLIMWARLAYLDYRMKDNIYTYSDLSCVTYRLQLRIMELNLIESESWSSGEPGSWKMIFWSANKNKSDVENLRSVFLSYREVLGFDLGTIGHPLNY